MPNNSSLSDDQIVDVLKKKRTDMKQTDMIATSETKPPPRKRGSKLPSIEANTTATNEEMADMIGTVLYWYNRPQVKSDQEVADRLNEYFQHLSITGEVPTVEKMAMALGVVRKTVWEWKNGNGCSTERSNLIKKAYDVLAALDAELVSRNKIPQVTYIFRAKNYFELSDTQQIVVTPNNPLDQVDGDEARKKYIQALPEIAADIDDGK